MSGEVAARASRKGIWGWMLFDWANQPFSTLVVTFVFGPWFVAQAIGDPVAGQALWGWASAIAGAAAAVLAPVLGAISDRTGARKAWVLAAKALAAQIAGARLEVVPSAGALLNTESATALAALAHDFLDHPDYSDAPVDPDAAGPSTPGGPAPYAG